MGSMGYVLYSTLNTKVNKTQCSEGVSFGGENRLKKVQNSTKCVVYLKKNHNVLNRHLTNIKTQRRILF
jgi:hypothetical protein